MFFLHKKIIVLTLFAFSISYPFYTFAQTELLELFKPKVESATQLIKSNTLTVAKSTLTERAIATPVFIGDRIMNVYCGAISIFGFGCESEDESKEAETETKTTEQVLSETILNTQNIQENIFEIERINTQLSTPVLNNTESTASPSRIIERIVTPVYINNTIGLGAIQDTLFLLSQKIDTLAQRQQTVSSSRGTISLNSFRNLRESLQTQIDDVVAGGITNLNSFTTTDLNEGANLYYTQARFDSAFGLKTTSDLIEDANLYFTNTRAINALTNQNISLFTNDSGYLSSIAGLNISQLNNDSGFLSSISGLNISDLTNDSGYLSSIAGLNISSLNNDSNFISNLTALTTDDLSQGVNNLYTQWATSGADISYGGGNVGIGNTNPTNRLTVSTNSGVGDSVDFALKLHNNDLGMTTTGLVFSTEGNAGAGANYAKAGIAFERNDTFARGNLHFLLNNSETTDSVSLANAMMTLTKEGRLGLNTSNPDYRFEVNNGVLGGLGGTPIANFRATDGGTAFLQTQNTQGAWKFGINASEQFTINDTANDIFAIESGAPAGSLYVRSSGNVGIGTTAPRYKVTTVGGDADVFGAISTGASSANSGAGIQAGLSTAPTAQGHRLGFYTLGVLDSPTLYRNGVAMSGYADQAWTLGSAQGSYLTFETTPNNSATRAEVMRLTSSGNVGIGTTNPLSTLTVNSTQSQAVQIHNPDASASRLWLTNANTGTTPFVDGFNFQLNTDGSVAMINRENQSMQFWTNNTERLRIDNSGNVGIGTTDPMRKLEIYSGAVGTQALFTGDAFAGLGFDSDNDGIEEGGFIYNSDGDWFLRTGANTSTNNRMTILNGGNVGIGASVPTDRLEITVPNTEQGGIKITNTAGSAGYLQLGNITTTSNNFAPYITGLTSSSNQPGLYFRGLTSPANDTGNTPVVRFLAMRDGLTPVTSRPLYAWQGYNGGFVNHMVMDAAGKLGIGTSQPLATLDITSTGSATPLAINKAFENGVRERLFTAKISDDATSMFFINNGTIGNGTFAPVFGGYSESTSLWPLGFGGYVPPAADSSNSSAFGLVDFALFRTTDGTDPLNGTLSNIQHRKLLTVRTLSNTYLTMNANGNLGLSTDPSARLHAVSTTEQLRLGYDSSNYWSSTVNSNGKLNITGTGAGNDFSINTDDLYVDTSSGNVGIGTTTPVVRLHNSDGTALASSLVTPLGTTDILTSRSGGIAASTLLVSSNTNTQRGVNYIIRTRGTTSAPTAVVNEDYVGDFLFGAYDGATLQNNAGLFAFVDGAVSSGVLPMRLSFVTGATTSGAREERLVIKSGGNVGIGTTDPSQKLHVAGNARFGSVGSGAYAFDLNLTADGTLTTSASDRRLKEDITVLDSEDILERITQLSPSSFTWKSNNAHDIGLIAQEVEAIFPELVFTNPTDGFKGINYSRFATLLISAVSNLAEKVEIMFAWFGNSSFNVQGDICVDDVCISKEEFKAILQGSGGSTNTSSSSSSGTNTSSGSGTETGETTNTEPTNQEGETAQEEEVVEEESPAPTSPSPESGDTENSDGATETTQDTANQSPEEIVESPTPSEPSEPVSEPVVQDSAPDNTPSTEAESSSDATPSDNTSSDSPADSGASE